jgi:hypothetical protein
MADSAECHLSGTSETIANLLSDEWEIVGCARCPMPLPMPIRGVKLSPCPCADLPLWPNAEIPQPRTGVCTTHHLNHLRQRLDERSQADRDRLQATYLHSPPLPQPSSDQLQAIAKRLQERSVRDAQ